MCKVSIIVVSYNTRELTLKCLRSVREQTQDTDFELLVVDNNSSDGSADAIASEFDQARLFAMKENLGFAAANNLASEHARGEWLLLLNPDTVILDRAIDKLVQFAKRDRKAGIIGGRTLFPDGQINPTSCLGRPTLWSTACNVFGFRMLLPGNRLLDPEGFSGYHVHKLRYVDIVTGCFLLLPRRLWSALGGFDPAFFMYGEETDLCLRAHRLGVRCSICPDATIIHYGGASEKTRANKIVCLFRAKSLIFRRHWSRVAAQAGTLMLDAWALSRLAAFAVLQTAKPQVAPSYRTWRDIWAQRRAWHVHQH